MSFIDCTSVGSRIQDLAKKSEIENSQNKSHERISELTVQFALLALLFVISLNTNFLEESSLLMSYESSVHPSDS